MPTDSEVSTWLDIASNLYNYALALGLTDLDPPTDGDTKKTLMRKTSVYCARLSNAQ